MNNLEFTFEESPWEIYLRGKGMGDRVSAAQLLSLLEEEPEEALEDALSAVETGSMVLDISGLPRLGASGQAAVRLSQEIRLAKQGLRPEELPEGDPLRLYLEELAQTPAWGDEEILAKQAAQGDQRAMERLTELGLSRVVEIAREHVGYGVLLQDLIQEGSLGLWQAVQTYRYGDYPKRRDDRIRFAMARAVTIQARASGIGQKLRQSMEDYRGVDERLLSQLGRQPTLEEIAQELHMDLDQAETLEKMLEDAKVLLRTHPEPEEPQEEEQAVEDTALFQLHQRIEGLLSELTEEEGKLLTLRFGLGGGKPQSPEEVGAQLGLPASEVLAKEAAALAKLRKEKA